MMKFIHLSHTSGKNGQKQASQEERIFTYQVLPEIPQAYGKFSTSFSWWQTFFFSQLQNHSQTIVIFHEFDPLELSFPWYSQSCREMQLCQIKKLGKWYGRKRDVYPEHYSYMEWGWREQVDGSGFQGYILGSAGSLQSWSADAWI